MRCFCLRKKRCTFGAMCAVGTLRNYFVIAKHKQGNPRDTMWKNK